MSSSFLKNHRRKTSLRRSDKTEVLKHGEIYHIGGKMKMKMKITKNSDNYNNQLMCSSPILKRHKIMMDEDLIVMEESSRTTTICDLCEEVLTEVLVRLSIKDIWACVCVQKSWLSLIKSPVFVTLYSNYQISSSSSSSSSNNPNPNNNNYLLFFNNFTGVYEIRLDDIECEKYLTIQFPPHLNKKRRFLPTLVSNGLICTFPLTCQTDHPIYLWNPVIQKYKTLPNSPHLPYTHKWTMWKAIAFSFLPQINDYVVIYIVKHGLWNKPHTHYIITCVYSLNTNSWRKITHNNLPDVSQIDKCDSFFVNGVAVWGGFNSQKKKIIMCFDTNTHLLCEMLLPKCADAPYHFPIIRPFGQSLVYFSMNEYDHHKVGMWVSKGDLMNGVLWEKKVTVKFENFNKARVLGLRNNGDPILCNSHDMISYNLDNYKSYDFVTSWDRWPPYPSCWDGTDDNMGTPFNITPFVESLALLDI